MNVMQREEELKSHLEKQIQLLTEAAQRFDGGNTKEAIHMTTRIRVLLHDTKFQTSLLTLLKRKDIPFYDTTEDSNTNNRASAMGLIRLKLGQNGGYSAPLDKLPPGRDANRKIPFEKWWNKSVFVDAEGNEWTRRGIVLQVAHKDRGVPVDPERDNAYGDLTRHKSLGVSLLSDGGEKEPTIGPEEAAVRQISYEVLKSLKDGGLDFFNKE